MSVNIMTGAGAFESKSGRGRKIRTPHTSNGAAPGCFLPEDALGTSLVWPLTIVSKQLDEQSLEPYPFPFGTFPNSSVPAR